MVAGIDRNIDLGQNIAMASRSFFDQPALPRLPQLLGEVRSGRILIPRFQRPFEWDDKRRVLLLDSIAKGVPIGSLLVWQTKTKTLSTFEKIGRFPIVASKDSRGHNTYLIDGHQRLTTLFAAFSNAAEHSSQDVDEIDDMRPIYVDLVSRDPAFLFVIPRRGKKVTRPTLVPVGDLLDGRKLFDAQRKLYEDDLDTEAQKLEELANTFKDYQIPVVPLITEEIDVVTDAFVRINSGGKPMSESYMVEALAYSRFPMRERTAQMVDSFADIGWSDLDDDTVLRLLKVRWELNVYDSPPTVVIEHFEKEKRSGEKHEQAFNRVFEEVEACLRGAIGFLRSVKVHGPAVLPYTYQLIALADVDRRIGGLKNLKVGVKDNLRRWFWSTTFGEYFVGKTSNKIRDAVDHLEAVARDTVAANPDDLKLDCLPLAKHSFKAARVRGRALKFLTLLGSDEERELRADQLGALGPNAMVRLDRKLDGRRAGARIVGDAEVLREVRDAMDDPAAHSQLLSEHLITADAAQLFSGGELEAFTTTREQSITQWETEILCEIGLHAITSAG